MVNKYTDKRADISIEIGDADMENNAREQLKDKSGEEIVDADIAKQMGE